MKFSEEHLFDSIFIKKHFQIPIVFGESFYLINDGKNSIVKIQDQKLSHSWTLEHPHSFTSIVTFCSEEDSIFCASDNNVLLKWSINDETLKNAAKFEFQENIFTVLTLQTRRPVVLFSSGKILLTELLYISLNPIGKSFLDEDEELVWADALTVLSEIKIVCLTQSKDKTYRLHDFIIKKENVTDYSCKEVKYDDNSLKDWCLNKYNFSFVTIWSNGAVMEYPLQNKIRSTLLTLKKIKSTNLLALSVLDSDHIILSIGNESKNETVLEMWDTKFASLKAKKKLKLFSTECHKILSFSKSIFFQSNESLTEVPFKLEKSTLASAIGKSVDVSLNNSLEELIPVEYSWKGSNVMKKESECNLQNKSENMADKMDTGDKTNQIEILAHCFMDEDSSFKTNIRESDLLELLRFALKLKTKAKQSDEFEPNVLLNAIFTSSFRDAALVQFIRKLNSEETLITLGILMDFLEGKISVSSSENPSDSQLFDWIFTIMKSHTEGLLLSKHQKKFKLLKRLDHCISQKIEEYEDYKSIENMVYLLQKKENILPTQHVVGNYFIEIIDI